MNNLIKNVEQWGLDKGLTGPNGKATPYGQLKKLAEEFTELTLAIGEGDEDGIADGIGDMTVVLTLLANMCGMSIHDCLNAAYNEIKNRNGKIVDGTFVKDSK